MNSSGDTDIDVDIESDTEIEADAEKDISTANTMRERAGESHFKLWVLLSANRLVVTAGLGVVIFAAFMLLGVGLSPSFERSLQAGDTIETIFSTMLGAIITGTTLIVTISQLVISQENGPLGDQHDRMSSSLDFRTYTSELIGKTAPADPSAFLRVLVNNAKRRARALRDSIASGDNDELLNEVDEFTESLTGNANEVIEELDGAKFGTFNVLFSALNFNYGWKIFQVERISQEYDDSLTDEDAEILSELKTSLAMFGPAREHIKTLYFQWALIDLSQLILYASIPALVVSGGMLAFVDRTVIPGVTLGVGNVLWVVGLAFTVSLLPFLLLVAYVVRIATVAKRTLAIGPLILRDSQR